MWCPDDSHPLGEIGVKEYDKIVLTVELSNNFGDSRIKSKVLDLAIEE